MRACLLAAVASLAAILSCPAGAILVRADRDDEEYRELATRYPSAVDLGPAGGAGVLIASRWVLTTAHRAKALREAARPPALEIGGRTHAIRSIHLHPEWRPGGGHDLALLFLDAPVAGVEPTPVYRDGDEAGQALRLVGFGATGRIGGRPAATQDRRRRAAINTVDAVDARVLGLRIKGPDEASDLQGAVAPGDSGGPAYAEKEGRILVAGILLASDDRNGDGIAGNAGDWDLCVRVSSYQAWIDDAMSRVAIEEAGRESPARKAR